MASTRGGKYHRLYEHLRGRRDTEWVASFREIEKILGFSLPASARAHHAWWANSRVGHNYAASWLDAGWRKKDLKQAREQVTFYREPVGDLPVEPDLSKRMFLIKVGSADCPGQLGDPEAAADWDGGIFHVDPPKKSGAKPQRGDLVLIWVNGPGNGLIATADIRGEVPEDVSTITVGDVKLLPGRRLDGDILQEFKETDPFLREIQRDRLSRLREIDPEMWRHLLAVREALNSDDELDDGERVGIARMVAAIRSRVAASGTIAKRQAPVRTARPPSELTQALIDIWLAQRKMCPLCGGRIPAAPTNAMLQMSPDRIDSGNPSYDPPNLQVTHLACNRAKNDSSTADFKQWLDIAKLAQA